MHIRKIISYFFFSDDHYMIDDLKIYSRIVEINEKFDEPVKRPREQFNNNIFSVFVIEKTKLIKPLTNTQ